MRVRAICRQRLRMRRVVLRRFKSLIVFGLCTMRCVLINVVPTSLGNCFGSLRLAPRFMHSYLGCKRD